MKTANHQHEHNVCEQITAQEKALGDLLTRLMRDPLNPVRESVDAIAQRLQSVEDLTRNTHDESLPSLLEAVSQLDKTIARQVRPLKASIEGVDEYLVAIKEVLHRNVSGPVSLQQDMQKVSRQLEAIGTTLDTGWRMLAEQNQTLSETVKRAEATLLAVHQTLNATSKAASKAASDIEQLHDDMGTVFNTTHAESTKLGNKVESLSQRIEGHQISTAKQLASLQPDLTQQLEALAVMIKVSADQVMETQQKNLEVRQAELSALMQDQFSLRIQPLRRTVGWLSVLCAASLLTSLGLLTPVLMR